MLVISKRYYKIASIKETPSGRCGYLSLASNPNLPLTHSIRKAFFIMANRANPNRIDLTGQKFHRLTVIEFSHIEKNPHRVYWKCLCDCGNIISTRSASLRNGHAKSCGCFKSETTSQVCSTHGHSKNKTTTPELRAYRGMKNRCYNTNVAEYENYWGRGIVVCAGWLESFENFFADMGTRPTDEHSLDRIDNDANYSCGHCEQCIENGWKFNCRWATEGEQSRNKRSNVYLNFNGKEMVLVDFMKLLNISRNTAKIHLKTRTPEQIAEYFSNKRNKK